MVSGDFNHNPHSSIIDLSEVNVIKDNFAEYYRGMIMNGGSQTGY